MCAVIRIWATFQGIMEEGVILQREQSRCGASLREGVMCGASLEAEQQLSHPRLGYLPSEDPAADQPTYLISVLASCLQWDFLSTGSLC